ncbi:MAG: hypothetical protein GY758_23695 [Fuerstiella sp.]|nr:hypothetical protein [Fuerstiella sp.]
MSVRFNGTQTDGTASTTGDGPETVRGVTSLPVGQDMLTVRYVREQGDAADVSNVDILTIDLLSVDVVSIVFGATAAEYQIDIQARNPDLMDSAFALLTDHLSLQEMPQP